MQAASKYVPPVLILVIIIIIIYKLPEEVFALSPFVHQEIPGNNKWYDLNNGGYINNTAKEYSFNVYNSAFQRPYMEEGEPTELNNGTNKQHDLGANGAYPNLNNLSHLDGVSYVSDGKFLNLTLWLSSPFENQPSDHKPIYGVLIDIDANPNTGWQGVDYLFQVGWNNKTNNWVYEAEEWSSNKQARIFNEKDNYTGFFGKGGIIGNTPDNYNNKYVHLSLDLDEIGPFSQGSAVFFIEYDFEKGERIADFTNWVPIPPPKFDIVPSPSNVAIGPLDNKIVQVEIVSNTSLPSKVLLNAEQPAGIRLNFPNREKEIYVPPYGIGRTYLSIYNMQNSNLNASKLQISAEIGFPNPTPQYFNFLGNKNIEVGSAKQIQRAYLSLSFLPPASLIEIIVRAWNNIGVAISGFIGLAVAIIGLIKKESLFKIWNKLTQKRKYKNWY